MAIETIVRRPTSVVVLFALLLLLSLYVLPQVPVELLPESMFAPGFSVKTFYPEASPEEVDKKVTMALSSALAGINGLSSMESTSRWGQSTIDIKMKFATGLSEAIDDARNKIDTARRSLPAKASVPQIYRTNTDQGSLMEIALRGTRSLVSLRKIAEETVRPTLERILGVATVRVTGGSKEILDIQISRDRLQAHAVSINEVASILSAQNWEMSAGFVQEGNKKHSVTLLNTSSSLAKLGDTIIRRIGGDRDTSSQKREPQRVIRLRDIATISLKPEETISSSFLDGDPAVTLAVSKASGTNALQVASALHKSIASLNRELPTGITLAIISDSSTMIRLALNEMSSVALTGTLLAVFVLLIFLRDARSTLIISLSIPLSLLITMTAMHLCNVTVNVMTLSGLILGIGMVIDSSIVILENIFRYREKGTKPIPSAILGSKEVSRAISSSVLTTICVFLPIMLFQEKLGLFGPPMQDIAFTVIMALLSSLVIALTLVPVLASSYLTLPTDREKRARESGSYWGRVSAKLHKGLCWVERLYTQALQWALSHKKETLLAAIGTLVGSVLLIPTLGFNLIPTTERKTIEVSLHASPGLGRAARKITLDRFHALIKEEKIPYTHMQSALEERESTVRLYLPDRLGEGHSINSLEDRLRSHFLEFPGTLLSFEYESSHDIAAPLSLIVRSKNIKLATQTAEDIVALITEHLPEVISPSVNTKRGVPLIEAIVDREKAAAFQIDLADLQTQVQENFGRLKTVPYRIASKKYDIKIGLAEKARTTPDDLKKLTFRNRSGQWIPFASFASFQRTSEPLAIHRVERKRAVKISAHVADGTPVSVAEARIKSLIQERVVLPDGVLLSYAGDTTQMAALSKQVAILLLIAIAFVFSIMASQFESLKDPFIIFLTVPMMVVGIVLLSKITGVEISAIVVVGLIMLAGIVVNNGIVLVDYTNLLVARDVPLEQACLEAGKNRLRPILMTSLTTIFGVMPMAFFSSGETSFVRPLGQAIVGGMLSSTVSVLFLAPVLYAVFNRKKGRSARKEPR